MEVDEDISWLVWGELLQGIMVILVNPSNGLDFDEIACVISTQHQITGILLSLEFLELGDYVVVDFNSRGLLFIRESYIYIYIIKNGNKGSE